MHDADAIRNLLGRYCEMIDEGDVDGVGDLFRDGTLCDEHGSVLAAGRAGVASFYERSTSRHDASPRTKHLVVNSVIDVDGDHATARSSYVVLQATDALALQPIIAGRYHDTFVREGDGSAWRFSERRFLVDLVGDLSHHLRIDLH